MEISKAYLNLSQDLSSLFFFVKETKNILPFKKVSYFWVISLSNLFLSSRFLQNLSRSPMLEEKKVLCPLVLEPLSNSLD